MTPGGNWAARAPATVLLGACAQAPVPGGRAGWIRHATPHDSPSAAYRWVEIALEATAREVDRNGARPTINSRQLAIALTAMYDAWAAYDGSAVGTRLAGRLRRPPAERTEANKALAIAHATFRALSFVFPEDADWLRAELRATGADPDGPADPATPAGVGRAAAEAVIALRRDDGSNQLGDRPGGSGAPYSDWTGYRPVNVPERIVDPDRWLVIPFVRDDGTVFAPGFLTPHWHRVRPFALRSTDQFRPGPFPKVGTDQLRAEVDECVAFNATLSLEQKAIVEFMRDGPRSTGQSGHWLRFAQDLSRRDRYGIDQDVKLFFAIANVCFDAFLAAWDAKRHYDSNRPYWYVRILRQGQQLDGWAGPGKGVVRLPAERWHPYSPASFVTPPFPGYPSGHSTVSGAAARTLALFSGSDRFEAYEVRAAGSLTEPGFAVGQMQAGQPDAGGPTAEVELLLPTFTATAEMAGISRVMGGYHIQADNISGLELGRKVADFSWPVYRALFEGTAGAPAEPAGRAESRH